MLWILAIIIILYVSSYLLFREKETFKRVRKWVDVSALIVTSILVIGWIEVFHYSFWFLIYFFISISIIVYLVIRLRKVEEKKLKAQKTIQILKDEEELLKEELEKK